MLDSDGRSFLLKWYLFNHFVKVFGIIIILVSSSDSVVNYVGLVLEMIFSTSGISKGFWCWSKLIGSTGSCGYFVTLVVSIHSVF